MSLSRALRLSELSFAILVILTSIFIPTTICLHEDQVGKFDWRRQFIGEPKFLYYEPSSPFVIVGTQENVIASLSIVDGSINWRNILPNKCILNNMFVLKSPYDANYFTVTTACANLNETYSWDAHYGLLVSDTKLSELLEDEQAESVQASQGQTIDQVWDSHSIPKSFPPPEAILKVFPLGQDKPLSGSKHIPTIVLVVSKELEMSVWNIEGNVLWRREESLASIEAVEFLHLPLSEENAEIALGLSKKGNSFINRLHSQYNQLIQMIIKSPQCFIGMLKEIFNRFSFLNISDPTKLATAEFELGTLHRDRFGLRKLIMVVTRYGNVFGLDTFTGQVVWKIFDKRLSTVNLNLRPIIIVTQESDFASSSRAVIVHLSGHFIEINPVTGQVIQELAYPKIKQVSTTVMDDQSKTQGILILDVDNKVHVFPQEYTQNGKLDIKRYYMTVVVKDNSIEKLAGYKFLNESNKLEAARTWQFEFNSKEKIIDISIKPVNEVVHSPARVLSDRGVLYKYVNPNLIAIMTQGTSGDSCSLDYYINIYLLDSITGTLVHSIHHPKARATAQLVHSENWLVYAFYNMKGRRTEISSLEMFEGSKEHIDPVFSSFTRAASLKPKLIEHKNFIFPSGIDVMVATTTLRAMTNRHLILGLPAGFLVEIPKNFLDPRRPINMLMEHREEGLIPYMPELPIPSESIINYNQTLLGIRKIVTSPAYLESTSLVFEYGLDIFFTRVTPSKTFDILKDDFDHVLITVVLIFLVVASYTTKLLAQRKALHAVWK